MLYNCFNFRQHGVIDGLDVSQTTPVQFSSIVARPQVHQKHQVMNDTLMTFPSSCICLFWASFHQSLHFLRPLCTY